jgi:ABC-type polysaccharide/polyol phosphate transport system ATPase subunit
MSEHFAVRVENVSKLYPLVNKRGRLFSLKGALLHGELMRLQRDKEGFLALSDVSFTVGEGETFAVIGPNGSGKSTILKLIAGILRPSTGSVEVNGRVTALIELGAGFHPEISGRENALVNGMMLGLSRAEILAKLPWIIEFSGVEPFIDQPVKTYSSGMYVRLGFAVAVAVEPRVLVVDEVLAVGDEAFVHRCLDRIATLQRQGTAVILVSHDLTLVEQLAQRALYLREGKPVLLGSAGAVVARYRSDVASVESAGVAQASRGQRWGNGDVELTDVELLDGSGRATRLLSSGEPAAIRLAYQAHEAQEDFVFGISVQREDGTHVFGTNTDLDGWRPEKLAGQGEMRIEFPSLELAPGRYLVDAAVHRKAGLAYDYACEVLSFTVGAPVPWAGSYAPRHRWRPSGPLMVEPASDEKP